jgi:hypothetical protein
MTRRPIAALSFALAALLALPAAAQLSPVPNDGPLYPGGPRRGIGPPSLSDNVPDLRLRPGGPPGLGQAPIQGGGGYGGPLSPGAARFMPEVGTQAPRSRGESGRHCRTAARLCVLTNPAPLGAGCSCRLPAGGRARGSVSR